uniref:Uncharacterized protein n=1 Tax=Meloidogyne enterolobii TaxID=390850 RepID=A0A6V7VHJ5_MELEN|nr:unnamed protein product [Meloidogyne enterolobii]
MRHVFFFFFIKFFYDIFIFVIFVAILCVYANKMNDFLFFKIYFKTPINRVRAELRTDTTSTDKTLSDKTSPKEKNMHFQQLGVILARAMFLIFFKSAIGFFRYRYMKQHKNRYCQNSKDKKFL